MAFFTLSNPIALFFALVVVLAAAKGYLGKLGYFKKKDNAVYILPIIILLGILMIAFPTALRAISGAVPYLVLLAVFLFLVGLAFAALGMLPDNIVKSIKTTGTIKISLHIIIICIIALGISQVLGSFLLEKGAEEAGGLGMIFSPGVFGMAMIVAIMGMIFYYVNLPS